MARAWLALDRRPLSYLVDLSENHCLDVGAAAADTGGGVEATAAGSDEVDPNPELSLGRKLDAFGRRYRPRSRWDKAHLQRSPRRSRRSLDRAWCRFA